MGINVFLALNHMCSFFLVKIKQLHCEESLELKLIRPLYLSIINVTRLIKLAVLRKRKYIIIHLFQKGKLSSLFYELRSICFVIQF